MIFCDNKSCPRGEWFHLDCLELSEEVLLYMDIYKNVHHKHCSSFNIKFTEKLYLFFRIFQ